MGEESLAARICCPRIQARHLLRFGDYEGALEEIQSRGIDITKPDKRDAQEGRPGRIAIAPEGGGANRLGVRGAAIRQACRCCQLASLSADHVTYK